MEDINETDSFIKGLVSPARYLSSSKQTKPNFAPRVSNDLHRKKSNNSEIQIKNKEERGKMSNNNSQRALHV